MANRFSFLWLCQSRRAWNFVFKLIFIDLPFLNGDLISLVLSQNRFREGVRSVWFDVEYLDVSLTWLSATTRYLNDSTLLDNSISRVVLDGSSDLVTSIHLLVVVPSTSWVFGINYWEVAWSSNWWCSTPRWSVDFESSVSEEILDVWYVTLYASSSHDRLDPTRDLLCFVC